MELSAFLSEAIAPVSAPVAAAVATGPVDAAEITALEDAASLVDGAGLQNGFGFEADGAVRVAVQTDMPGVTPAMWDWWFGWHGSSSERYKLWHPKAHVSARWADGSDAPGYVGRTSLITEYLGARKVNGAIQFRPQEELGFGADETAICARVGSGDAPVDVGWLVHYVGATPDGAVMRSRFWLGGHYVAPRTTNPLLRRTLPPIGRRLARPTTGSATDLLVHCAEEMSHLAAFLPALHAEFGDV